MNKTSLTVLSILSIFLFNLPGFAADRIDVGTTAAVGGEQAIVPVTIENDVPLVAFSFGLIHDPALLTPVSLEYAGPIVPDFLATTSEPEGHTIGVVFDYQLNNLIPAGGPRLIAFASYLVTNTASVSNFATVIPGTVGNPPIDPEFSDGTGAPITPLVEGGGIGVLAPLPSGNPADLGPVLRALLHDEVNAATRFVTLDPASGAVISSTPLSCAGNPRDVMVDVRGLTWTATDTCGIVVFDATGNLVAEVATGTDPLALIGISGDRIGVTHADGTLQVIYPDGTVLFGGDGVGDSAEDGLLGAALSLDGGTAFDEYVPGSGNSAWLAGGERLVRLRPNGNVVVDRLTEPGQSIADLAQGPNGSVFVLTTNRLEHLAADGTLISSTDLIPARLALSLASIPTNASGEEEALVGVLSQGSGTDTLLTTYSTSGDGLVLIEDGVVANSATAIEYGLIAALSNSPTSVISGIDANGDGTVSVVSSSGVSQQTFPGERVFINAASTAVPVTTFFGGQDFDGDQYSNLDELLSGSSAIDALEDPSTLIPDYVAPMGALTSVVIADNNANGFDEVLLQWSWDSPAAADPDSFEITRITDGVAGDPVTVSGIDREYVDLDPPAGTHVYVGVANRQGGTSSSEESVLVIGAGEVEQEVPIDVPYEFTEIYDITVNPTAPDDGARYYCTDSANGQIYALDINLIPVAIIPSPFPVGVPCTGIAYVRSGDGNNGSLVIGNGQAGGQLHLIEITLSGEFIRDYFLFAPIPFNGNALFQGAISGSSAGIGYDEDSGKLYVNDVQGGVIWGMSHGGSGEIDPNNSFDHPSEGSSQKGCTTKRCQQSSNGLVGCSNTILLTSQTEDDTLEIIEVTVDNGVATQIGEGISIAGIEDPGGIVIEGGSITVTGNSDGTVYEVQATGSFTRADTNEDFLIDIGDVITSLDYLFSGEEGPECLARLDINDDNLLDIGDPIYLLNALFVSGSPNPPEPFGSFADLVTGPDPTPSVVTPCP